MNELGAVEGESWPRPAIRMAARMIESAEILVEMAIQRQGPETIVATNVASSGNAHQVQKLWIAFEKLELDLRWIALDGVHPAVEFLADPVVTGHSRPPEAVAQTHVLAIVICPRHMPVIAVAAHTQDRVVATNHLFDLDWVGRHRRICRRLCGLPLLA